MFNIHIPLSDGSGVVDIEPFDENDLGTRPLGHKELVHYLTSPEREFHLTMTNLRVPTSQTGLAEDGPVRFEGRMTSNSKGPPLMGLLVGGWLPFPHASSEVVFIDRNVVSTIEAMSAAELMPPTAGSGRHFEPRHAFELAGAHVSPLPYVLEGRHKRLPQLSDIRRSLVRAQAALRRVLPAKSVLSLTAQQREGVLRMLGDMARYHPKNYAFLREVCPLVSQPLSAAKRLAAEGRILDAAMKHKVAVVSLPVFAVLSALYDNEPSLGKHKANRPGRAVLKPTANYSEEEAYNALVDLGNLELLVTGHIIGLGRPPALYTHDQGLAALWAALEPRNIADVDGFPKLDMTLTAGLVPALSEKQRVELAQRLRSRTA